MNKSIVVALNTATTLSDGSKNLLKGQ